MACSKSRPYPIENAWGWLSHEVYKDTKQYDREEELKSAIMKAWDEIPEDYMTILIFSMKNMIFGVIKGNVGDTRYWADISHFSDICYNIFFIVISYFNVWRLSFEPYFSFIFVI